MTSLVFLVVLVLLGPDPEGSEIEGMAPAKPTHTVLAPGVLRTMWEHRIILIRLGLASAAMSAVRSARLIVLPLWGLSLDLDATTIALVVGLSGAIDFALFYPVGQVVDRFGTRWAAIPSMLLTGAGFLTLALTHDLDTATGWFIMMAVVLGLSNASSSVVLLSVGSDAAPQTEPAAFLGSWRTLMDAGAAAAPLLIAGLTAATALPLAVAMIGIISVAGAGGFHRWLPDPPAHCAGCD